MRLSTTIVVLALAAVGLCHRHENLSAHELRARKAATHKRHAEVRSACSSHIAAYHSTRKAKRNLAKRSLADVDATVHVPHHSAIENYTCVTAPEVMEGPYYINNEQVRQDLRDDQPGIKLVLDVGVIDVLTCEPLEDALVELWTANATGVYSSYSANLEGPPPGPPGGPGGPGKGPGRKPSGGDKGPPSKGGKGRPPGPPHGSPAMTANETFLRGGWMTDADGIAEMTLVYPGHYAGRATHIHTMVHVNWSMSDNGTLISHAGNVAHIGQLFFDDDLTDQVHKHWPYSLNKRRRVRNSEDPLFEEENADGNNAIIEIDMLTDNIADGLLGYITFGVNSSASYDIHNTNYLNSSTKSVDATGDASANTMAADDQDVLVEGKFVIQA
ncbi:aromatic compound dioxygenase [Punctularia strigosozonata HHB-11173 SS5]|uniref:aromatic compound dioxygenase n=1 Tax=Punctularia strigosozonata (strain HHB-11173) TaxID=741275 RepID=UPI000441724B|nr:aromatic compound dioxygenase [Punctularia strigosozonata HHB-11173 SS5]EIN10567.1 aromatic compound dioxygenase [Punctularia strigosozonata HHB-11173 SS5]